MLSYWCVVTGAFQVLSNIPSCLLQADCLVPYSFRYIFQSLPIYYLFQTIVTRTLILPFWKQILKQLNIDLLSSFRKLPLKLSQHNRYNYTHTFLLSCITCIVLYNFTLKTDFCKLYFFTARACIQQQFLPQLKLLILCAFPLDRNF